jgi:flagellar assembly factor FliW
MGEEKKEKIGNTEEQPLVNNSDKMKEDTLIVESREYRVKRPVEEEKPK